MPSVYGTTEKTGAAFKKQSQGARPATGGNKNVRATAKRKSAESMVPASHTTPLAGPDRGTG